MAEKETPDNPAPAAVPSATCPQCGGTLVAFPALDKRAMVKAMVQGGSPAPYAQNFVDQHHEKEAAHGVVHVCQACRYVTRVKEAA